MKTITLKCDRCNCSFERKRSEHLNNVKRGRKSNYCSLACFNNTPKSRVCQACQKTFEYTYPSQKYCCRRCWGDSRPQKLKFCLRCSVNGVSNKEKYCKECRYSLLPKSDIHETTLKVLRDKYSASQYHAKIRGHARKIYLKSGKPLTCYSCGYDLHVDICHIVDVKDFPTNAVIGEVNDIKNLVALDKRCHWEFDNGYLRLSHP